ncbi:patatin-like phospholipase family protein [Rhizobium sp. BK060]|uniref:patatin-like phospholipase family protein n=1 Tax=Rhizobium sp. BK060 TaxID=2587096 RepID=UPI0016179AC8|nr:patatin-like phospholipase family protein [Rhizobium sp. BK060]MBB3397125.1 patatin-like phospholipase/acyl hydrolase [Rhizobium sp. BK060]
MAVIHTLHDRINRCGGANGNAFYSSDDGGGIRGIIPAVILVELAKQRDGLPLHKAFNLITGTSTGGIIAAGLTCPQPSKAGEAACTPADLLGLYANEDADPGVLSFRRLQSVRP